MNQTKNKARRLILRSLVLGGSATAATKLMPDAWIRPVVKTVISPSHAVLSIDNEEEEAMPTGIYRAEGEPTNVSSSMQFSSPLDHFAKNAKNQSVLDYFIQPAIAQSEEEECPMELPGDITFNIMENPGTVDICLGFGIPLSSSIDGTEIDDFSYNDNNFTNLVASDAEITGTLDFPSFSEANTICSIDFTAPLVDDVFSCDDE